MLSAKKSKKPKRTDKPPEYDAITQTCVKYGPPDADFTSLPTKIVSREQFDQAHNLKQIFEGSDKVIPVRKDDYQDEDSDQDVSKPSQTELNAKKKMKITGVRTSVVDGVKSSEMAEGNKFYRNK